MSAVDASMRTMGLFVLLTLLFAAIGWILGTAFQTDPYSSMGLFIGIALLMNLVSYFFSDKLVLRMYRAKIVTEAEAPKLYRIVRTLAMKADLPMPKVAIIPTQNPNAFATGRNPKNAVVAATQGLLNLLNDEELEGVLAHEMAHVKNRDMLIMTVAATLAGAITFVARVLGWNALFGRGNREVNPIALIAVIVLAPLAALLIQLGISRSREYKADAKGAEFIGKPWALANALEKLAYGNQKRPIEFGDPSSSALFIVNPFRGRGFINLFSTHPPMEERIKRLRAMA